MLIDDLVTKTITEPYRMMTSLAEYRLLLRQDNADRRLADYGREVGLLSEKAYEEIQRKWATVDRQIEGLRQWRVSPSAEVNQALEGFGSTPLQNEVSGEQLLRRPEMSYDRLIALGWEGVTGDELRSLVETEIKYAGYIRKQERAVDRFRRLEARRLPDWLDYGRVEGLSKEAQEKLAAVRPTSLGQASRIAGVSPADISVLMIYLEHRGRSERG